MKRLCIMLFLAALPGAAGASFFDDDASNPCVNAGGALFETVFTTSTSPLSPAIARELLSAKKSIRVAARDFMSKPVTEALVKAARAGVDLKVVLDRKINQGAYSASQFLLNVSLPAHLTKGDSGLYSDYIVVDERDVILGNIAPFADEEEEKKHAASVLIIHNAPDLAKHYLANWQMLWAASEVMKPDKE